MITLAQTLVGAAVAPGFCGGLTARAPVVDLVFGDSDLARNQLRRARHLLIGKPLVSEREREREREREVAPRTIVRGDILHVVGIATTRLTLRQGRHPDQRRTLHGKSEEFC